MGSRVRDPGDLHLASGALVRRLPAPPPPPAQLGAGSPEKVTKGWGSRACLGWNGPWQGDCPGVGRKAGLSVGRVVGGVRSNSCTDWQGWGASSELQGLPGRQSSVSVASRCQKAKHSRVSNCCHRFLFFFF